MTEGKKFEKDFENSIPKGYFFLRLNDAAGWSTDNKTRFTVHNPCDYILKQNCSDKLYMLELKSTKGKSIPIDRLTEQADRMEKYRDTAEPGFIINFRDHERTYWMPLLMFRVFVYYENRKSIPFDWFEQCWLIPQEIKRTRYRYTIDEVFI